MPRTGTGIYNLPAGQPVVTGTTISSSTFNTLTADLATALTSSLASDGQTVPTANIQLGGFKLTNVGAGSATTDGATIGGTETLTNKTLTSPTVTASKNDKLQIGVSGTATNNFTLTAEAADGSMKLARGNAGATTQDVMTVDSSGKVSFPQNLNTPVFSGSNASSGAISSNVMTKLTLSTVAIDTASWWNAGNTRYIPQVAGYYEVTVLVSANSTASTINLATAAILKNGSSVTEGSYVYGSYLANVSDARSSATSIVSMNGSTDYIEPAARVVGTGTLTVNKFDMQVKLVRAGL